MRNKRTILSDEAIQEDYEDLVFEKVMAIHCEEESRAIVEDIAKEKKCATHDNTIEKLFKKKERKENMAILLKFAKKGFVFAASFFFVVVLSLSSVVVAFADVREYVKETIYNLVYLHDEKYTQISAGESVGFVNPELYDWEGAFAPTYLTAGYAHDSKFDAPGNHSIIYTNGDKTIVFAQFETSNFNIDTENANIIETLIINESEALLVIKGEEVSIGWNIGDTMLYINGYESREEIIKIASGIKIIK